MPGEAAVLLARTQFALTVGFHIVLPAFSIGLASYLAVLEVLWLLTRRQVYRDVYQYWLKAFAITFGMGVVSGVVMSYEFGTNWARFADKAGPVIGPLMGYEVLTAFFLEAGFLGIMLFGRERVSRGIYCFATLMVAAGTLLSAFWILAANSWMQTPQGHAVTSDGRFEPVDWWQVIFNPSFPYRLVHMVIASYLSVAFVVGAVGAWHMRRDLQNQAARLMFSMAMWMAVIVAPLQVLAGDQHGLNTLEHQPAKVAALEGDWESRPGQPLILFGMPNMEKERTDWAIEIPHLGALVLTHTWNGAIKGLKDFPPQDRPYAPVVFWAFRIMVGLGLLMAVVGIWGAWLRIRNRLYTSTRLRRAMLLLAPSGFIALLAGWTVTEAGRQPFTVYGLLRTADSASPIDAPGVAASLGAFVVVYAIVFGAGFFFLFGVLRRPPTIGEPGPRSGVPVRSAGITPAPALSRQP
jgi:cytochrome bd ubiquinol oxidase subunit I